MARMMANRMKPITSKALTAETDPLAETEISNVIQIENDQMIFINESWLVRA